MPGKNPRVNPLYEVLDRLAWRDGPPPSLKASGLIRNTLEAHEDLALAMIAEDRERTFDSSRALAHREVWRSPRRVKKR